MENQRRGLYLHIPFCARKCHYCDFVITVKKSSDIRAKFFASLEAEIRRVREVYGPLKFDTLYLGGGTPSLLSVREMEELIAALRRHFTFKDGFEFTVEVNPGDAGREKAECYRRLGVNRISVGTQSFNDRVLETCGRLHRKEENYRTLEILKETGFRNISLDFIIGLPGQAKEDLLFSLSEAVRLDAAQVVMYDLDIHEKTLFGARRRRGTFEYIDEEIHYAMCSEASAFLTGAGYAPYEISSYAKPGFESRHNLIYWNNEEYLGLGPGAFSYLRGRRFQYAAGFNAYLEKSQAGDWEPDVCDVLSSEEKEIETFMTGLRLKEGIDLARVPAISPKITEKLPELVRGGFISFEGGRVRLADKGRFLADAVFAELIPESGIQHKA